MNDADCVAFLQWALPRLGLHWPGFRKIRGQVCKRIARGCSLLALPDVATYRDYQQFRMAVQFVLQDIRHTVPQRCTLPGPLMSSAA